MSDSIDDLDDRINSPSPRFSGALIGRILAVGLFVTLGTFAVYQSVIGERGKKPSPEISAELLAQNPKQQSVFKQPTKDEGKIEPTSFDGSTESPSSRLPKTSPITTTTSNAFGGSKPLPQIKSKPVVAKGFPAAQPAGLKQAASSVPKIPSIPSIPKTTPQLAQLTDNAAKATSQFADNLRAQGTNALTQTKDAATQATSDTLKNAGNAFKSNFSDGGFNAKPSVAKAAPTTPPARPAGGGAFGQVPKANNILDNAKAAFDTSGGLRPSSDLRPKTTPTNPLAGSTPRGIPPLNTPNGTGTTGQAAKSFGGPPTRPNLNNNPALTPVRAQPPRALQSNLPNRPDPNSLQSSRTGSATGNPLPGLTPPVRQQPTRPPAGNGFDRFNNNNTIQAKPAAARTPVRSSNPPTNAIGNRRSPVAPTGMTPVTGSTMSTPGDRVLEGMQAPSLTIEKIAPREIQVNQEAEFQTIVRNVGRVVAEQVTIHDRVPAGAVFVSADPQPARTGVGGTGNIQWALGELRPGQEKRVTFKLKPTRQGEIGSVARLAFETKASMRTLVTKPVLKITHTTNPKVLIGDRVILDVLVENKGDGACNDVVIEENVPNQLEYSEGYRHLEYPIGNLAPGQSRRVQLSLRAAQIGHLNNVVMASAHGDIKAQHALKMEVIAPQLKTTADGPTRRYINREATHHFTVENRGTAPATNVELIARMPSGLRFVSADKQGKYDPNSHAVYWSLSELRPGPTGKVQMKSVPTEPGEQPIKFEAIADLNQKTSSETKMVVEHLTDVYFEIDDVVDPIEVGSATAYRIRVVNQGTNSASNVQLQVDFPAGIKPTSVDGNLPNEMRTQTVVFAPISSLNPGDEVKIVVNGEGKSPGDHRVAVQLKTDGRVTNVSKEETTKVYNDRRP